VRANPIAQERLDAFAARGRRHPAFVAAFEIGGKFFDAVSVAKLPLLSTRPAVDVNFAAGYGAVIYAGIVTRRSNQSYRRIPHLARQHKGCRCDDGGDPHDLGSSCVKPWTRHLRSTHQIAASNRAGLRPWTSEEIVAELSDHLRKAYAMRA
jgi:hypothetical protein